MRGMRNKKRKEENKNKGKDVEEEGRRWRGGEESDKELRVGTGGGEGRRGGGRKLEDRSEGSRTRSLSPDHLFVEARQVDTGEELEQSSVLHILHT